MLHFFYFCFLFLLSFGIKSDNKNKCEIICFSGKNYEIDKKETHMRVYDTKHSDAFDMDYDAWTWNEDGTDLACHVSPSNDKAKCTTAYAYKNNIYADYLHQMQSYSYNFVRHLHRKKRKVCINYIIYKY